MLIEDNLKNLKIVLPDPKDPVGTYVASKKIGNILFISGQISINEEGKLITGKLGSRFWIKDKKILTSKAS